MSLRQQAVSGVFWSAIQNWGANLVGVAIYLVLAYLLDASAFGLLAMAMAVVAILEVLLRQGLGQAIVQREELDTTYLNTAFWTCLLASALLTGFAVLAAPLVASLVDEPRVAPVLRWLSLSFVLGGIGHTHQAILQRRFAFKSLAIRSIVAVVAGGVVGIVMALSGYGVWSLVGQNLTMNAVGSVILWFASDWRPGLGVSLRGCKELFAFGGNVMGIEGLIVVNRRVVDLLIGSFLGSELLGYFNLAQLLIMTIVNMLTQTLSAVALPTFSRLQHDLTQMRNAFYTTVQVSCMVGFPAFVGVAVVAPELVVEVLGDKWAQSVPLIRILALMGIMYAAFSFNRVLIVAMGKPSWFLKLTIANVVMNVLAVVVAARWGIVAVAWAYALQGYVFVPFALWMVRKLAESEPVTVLRQCITPLIASCVMAAGVIAVRGALGGWLDSRVLLALCVLLGALVYVGAILLVAPALLRKSRELIRLAFVTSGGEVGTEPE
ncbi:MAG: lipopolysaccharide biosynthesis protein [Phycisphaerales bacterium]|nr:MAG: lipopolysaccharide biosynthesis protein [Phycisphaerales bacterium]